MNYEQIAVEILEQVTGAEGLADDKDMDLFEAGLLDSLAVITIIIQLEQRTGVILQPTDFRREDIASVAALARFMEDRGIGA